MKAKVWTQSVLTIRWQNHDIFARSRLGIIRILTGEKTRIDLQAV